MRTGSQLTRANSVIEFATYTTQRRGVMIDRCSAKSWTNGHPKSSSGWMVGQHFDECFGSQFGREAVAGSLNQSEAKTREIRCRVGNLA
jgi:hypothetical protein